MMPPREAGFYKAFWVEHNRIVFVELIGYFHTDLLNRAYEHIKKAYIEPGKNPVHVVMDIKGLTRHSKQLDLAEVKYNTPSSTAGWLVLVGFDNLLRNHIAIVAPQIFKMDLICAETLNEALNTLRKHDITLNKTI